MPVTSTLDQGVRSLALDLAGRLADRFVEEAQGRCSRRSGALADSIVHDEPVDEGDEITCHVEVGEEYGIYQDTGTGVYGPEGRRIEGNPLLAFDWAAAGGLVIVHSVAGSPGTHFWSETVTNWPNIVRSVS